jgi:hypothetical protein
MPAKCMANASQACANCFSRTTSGRLRVISSMQSSQTGVAVPLKRKQLVAVARAAKFAAGLEYFLVAGDHS